MLIITISLFLNCYPTDKQNKTKLTSEWKSMSINQQYVLREDNFLYLMYIHQDIAKQEVDREYTIKKQAFHLQPQLSIYQTRKKRTKNVLIDT